VAVKVIEKAKLTPELHLFLNSEINILKLINHENIVKVYDILEDDYNVYIFMELCNQGNL
jgi:serine/threonine protein kinase